jgi:hypothetical protein
MPFVVFPHEDKVGNPSRAENLQAMVGRRSPGTCPQLMTCKRCEFRANSTLNTCPRIRSHKYPDFSAARPPYVFGAR